MDWCCVCGDDDDWSGKHTCGVCGGHFGGEERVAKLSKWKNVANFSKCFFSTEKASFGFEPTETLVLFTTSPRFGSNAS